MGMEFNDTEFATLSAKLQRVDVFTQRAAFHLANNDADSLLQSLRVAEFHIKEACERVEFLVSEHVRVNGL